MSFLRELFSPQNNGAMKTIVYRGGVVTFRIPAHWHEEYSDTDGAMFYERRFSSGRTVRLTIATMRSPGQLRTDSGCDVLQLVANKLHSNRVEYALADRPDGNAILRYEESTSERGVALTIFYWVIANPIPPRHARIATFSYTIRADERHAPKVERDLEMLESEIAAATFSPILGVKAE